MQAPTPRQNSCQKKKWSPETAPSGCNPPNWPKDTKAMVPASTVTRPRPPSRSAKCSLTPRYRLPWSKFEGQSRRASRLRRPNRSVEGFDTCRSNCFSSPLELSGSNQQDIRKNHQQGGSDIPCKISDERVFLCKVKERDRP